jgi:hypothetical protein
MLSQPALGHKKINKKAKRYEIVGGNDDEDYMRLLLCLAWGASFLIYGCR